MRVKSSLTHAKTPLVHKQYLSQFFHYQILAESLNLSPKRVKEISINLLREQLSDSVSQNTSCPPSDYLIRCLSNI